MTKPVNENVALNLKRNEKKKKRALLRKELWRHRELFLLMLPALVIITIFTYGPMPGVLMAFQDAKIGVPILKNEWVGFKHFIRLFNGHWFPIAIKNTVIISFLQTIACWPFPIVLALLLHNSTNTKIKKVTQMVTYIPHLLSMVVVVSILNVFCSGESGLINILLIKLGMERINFFGSPDWVRPLYIISYIWVEIGYGAIIYMGALSTVDEEQIEAAQIDGANKLQCIWHIQLPTILPTIATMLILNVGKMFNVGADKMLLMQTDLNLSASEILSTYTYKMGFQSYQYGFSTAIGLFQGIINLILLLSVNKISKKLTDVSVI